MCKIASDGSIANMPLSRFYAIIMVSVTVGCGSTAVVPHKTETAPTNAFDGSYRTTIRTTSKAAAAEGYSWCKTPGQPIITVTNGRFDYAVPHPDLPGHHQATTYQATIGSDGLFVGQSIQGTIRGQVRGTRIDGSIDGVGCVYAFTGDRI